MLFSNRLCDSHRKDGFIIFLKLLLMHSIILIGSTTADCNHLTHIGSNRHMKEAAKKSPELVLSSPEECLRPCKDGEPPKTCYWHFTLELYPVLGEACDYCRPNWTNSISSNCQCVTANGFERMILTVNRMLPGPSLQVCQGDGLVIDVDNQMEGMETAIHWHGVFQNGTQYYDGVSRLTQCPIAQGTTFRYHFIAANEGTHFWHAHVGVQKMDGIYGSLVIRQPDKRDPNSHLYHYDLARHVMVLSDIMREQATARFPGRRVYRPGQTPDSLLINGKGQIMNPITGNMTTTPSEEFVVKPGRKYRFRIINAWCTVCPSLLVIENHTMEVIATDGAAVKPRNISSLISLSGERYDVIIHANHTSGSFWIHMRGLGECNATRLQQTAILRYEGTTSRPSTPEPTYDEPDPPGILLNPLDGNCSYKRKDALCVNHLRSALPVDRRLLQAKPDITFYLPFQFFQYTAEQLFRPNTYEPFLVTPAGFPVAALVDNITFQFPPSPPLSQLKDIPTNIICNSSARPADCGTPCRCTNILNIPLGSIVEIITVDTIGLAGLSHPFHLHGYNFHVMGMGLARDLNETKISLARVRNWNKRNMLRRNLKGPAAKDTIAVPTNGYTIGRFRADNPGYWLFHCHFIYHIVDGMEVVFHVGTQKDLPPVPKGFPTCGNWVPQITPIKN